MKIKITTGFRKDQQHSIPAEEAHKAYFLFLHPEARTIFSSGLALKGSDIQAIEPDLAGSMGWNPEYRMTPDDWNEIHRSGLEARMAFVMSRAKEVAQICAPEDLALPLPQLLEQKFPQLAATSVVKHDGLRSVGEILKKNG